MRNFIKFFRGLVVFYDDISSLSPILSPCDESGEECASGSFLRVKLRVNLKSGNVLEPVILISNPESIPEEMSSEEWYEQLLINVRTVMDEIVLIISTNSHSIKLNSLDTFKVDMF